MNIYISYDECDKVQESFHIFDQLIEVPMTTYHVLKKILLSI